MAIVYTPRSLSEWQEEVQSFVAEIPFPAAVLPLKTIWCGQRKSCRMGWVLVRFPIGTRLIPLLFSTQPLVCVPRRPRCLPPTHALLRTKRHIRSPMDWHEPDCDTSIVAPRLQLPPAPQRHPSTGIPIGATSACIGLRQSWERGSATLAVSTLARVRAAVPLEPAPKKEILGSRQVPAGCRHPAAPNPWTKDFEVALARQGSCRKKINRWYNRNKRICRQVVPIPIK